MVDDAVEWALDGDAEAMIAEAVTDLVPPCPADADAAEALARAVRCPMLLIHGSERPLPAAGPGPPAAPS